MEKAVKVCRRCKEEKATGEFIRNRSSKDGLGSYCKDCKKLYRQGITNPNKNHQLKYEDGEKVCSRCEERKPFFEFSKSSTGIFGLQSACKTCTLIRLKEKQEGVEIDGKVCGGCNTYKEIEGFSKNVWSPDGYCSQCKECSKRWARENPDKANARYKAWRDRNPEQAKQIRKTYYEEHRDVILEYSREWYQENRDQHLENSRQWSKENRIKKNEYKAKRTALEEEKLMGEVDYEAVVKRDGYWCHLCGGSVKPNGIESDSLSIDHVDPITKTGLHSMDNLKVAHRLCNLIKSNHEDWREWDWQAIRLKHYGY